MSYALHPDSCRAVPVALQEEVAHHVASFMLQDLRHAMGAPCLKSIVCLLLPSALLACR